MIFTTISYKMLSLPPSSPQCKSSKRTTLPQCLLLILTLIVYAQAGVIKKREIPFTIETTTSSVLTITPNIDPDIAQNALSQVTTSPVPITTTTATVVAETTTNEPATKLVVHSSEMKSSDVHSDHLGSSREYVLNEIAFNETKKQARTLDQDRHVDGQKLMEVNIRKTERVAKVEPETDHVEGIKSNKNLETYTETTNAQAVVGNGIIGSHLVTVGNDSLLRENPVERDERDEILNKPMVTNVLNVTTEMMASLEDLVTSTTTSTTKDNTIETNHIMQPTKHPQVTTEIRDAMPGLQHSVSTENVQVQKAAGVSTLSQDLSEKENAFRFSETTTIVPLSIHDALDRESLKEISNDLPEKTTESSFRTETVLDSNKVDHARSMFMSGERDIIATTLLPREAKEIETSTSLPNSHLDHLKNSIDIEEFTPAPLNEKKAKFINDNSTNAQKLNLPNNAEVWSLAGMKPITSSANVTIETAPKHKHAPATPQEKQWDRDSVNTNSGSSINNSNSEKFLLDWSHIMMDKELATTANYQENMENVNAEKVLNIHSVSTTGPNESKTSPPTTTSPPGITEAMTNVPILETFGKSSADEPSTITANSTTILSVSSFDNNNENTNKHELLLSTSPASVTVTNRAADMMGEVTTATMPTATAATALEAKANPDLNEINLTLNKTITDVGETSQHRDEQHAANNRHVESDGNVNVNVHNDVTSEPRLTTTTVIEGMTNSYNISTTTTTASEAPLTTTTTATTTTTTTKTTVMPMTTSTADTTSSEPTTTLSTLETGKANASNTSSERNTIFDDSEKRQGIKSEKNNNNIHASFKLGDKENIEIFATTAATTITTTDTIPITTYKPKFVNLDLNPRVEQTNTTTSTPSSSSSSATANKIPIAEVVDQNGNEIEHNKSINVETTTQPISDSFNIPSTTIKTHLNEQVFEFATTTTITPTTTTSRAPYNTLTTESSETSEKTTSSTAKDEIINGKDFQLEENNIITTPKTPTTTSYPPSTTEQVEHTAIGPSTPLEQQNKEDKELEATTTRTDTSETPVVAQPTTTQGLPAESSGQTTTLPTTTTTRTSSDEDKDTSKVDTYFKYPIHNKGPKKEESTTVEPIKDDKLATTTMSLKPTSTTTEQEDINISLLNETDISITSTTPQVSINAETEERIYTTATVQITTSTHSPPPQPTPPTILPTDSDASTKIDEIYKVVISSTTESQQFTTQSSEKVTEIGPESPPKYTTTTTRFSNNINEDLYTTLSNNFNEEFTTMLPPKVITADVGAGGGANSLPPLMGGNSGNMFPKNSEASGETDVNVIIAITVSVIGVIALILLVAFLYLMRKRQKQTSYSQRCRPVSLDEYAIDNASVGGSMRKGSALRSSKRTYGNLAFDDPSLRHNPLGVHELAKFSMEKLRIFEEFRDVPQITAREDEVPQGCEDKNRYANVLPLPESRVVLQRQNDDYKTEYINANYVTGPKDKPNYYIACQAPLDFTVEDFWRMIWEQQSRVIIQATDLIENGVEKCAEYLPPSVTLDNHSTFGDFQITLQNREVKDKYAISTILLKHHGENVTRELTHYWYKWPETGVPVEEAPIIAMLLEARSSLISYAIEQANEDKESNSTATLKSAEEGSVSAAVNGSSSPKAGNVSINGGSNGEINGNISMVPMKKTARNQGPLTIHCSPGTGRTGTIIACDVAIRSLETPKRTVDIPHIVYYVRRGRASAVLTKEQYEFIYKVANVYAAKISNPTSYN